MHWFRRDLMSGFLGSLAFVRWMDFLGIAGVRIRLSILQVIGAVARTGAHQDCEQLNR